MSSRRRVPILYGSLHARLRAVRGKAATYSCVECRLRQAEDWSYDHSDPNELPGCPYSLDLFRYRPLCRGCHGKFDADNRVVRASLLPPAQLSFIVPPDPLYVPDMSFLDGQEAADFTDR